MSKIPCEVISDLLPSYIDKLTSDVTNKEIEEHLVGCEKCKKTLQQMSDPKFELNDDEVKEINFLKKTKKTYHKKIVASVVSIILIAVLCLTVRTYFFGQDVNSEYLSYDIDVNEDKISIGVNTISKQGIQKIEVNENQGVVKVNVKCVPKSFFYKENKTIDFNAKENIQQVWIGDRIVWDDGEEISALTSSLYAAYNPYIGDMPSNAKIAQILNMVAYTGSFKNELQTSQEPYVWKISLDKEFSTKEQKTMEEQLRNYAYIYLAEIGNLGEVTYEYKLDGKVETISVTKAEATEFIEVDIKKVGKDVKLLEKLVEKTGISNVTTSS